MHCLSKKNPGFSTGFRYCNPCSCTSRWCRDSDQIWVFCPSTVIRWINPGETWHRRLYYGSTIACQIWPCLAQKFNIWSNLCFFAPRTGQKYMPINLTCGMVDYTMCWLLYAKSDPDQWWQWVSKTPKYSKFGQIFCLLSRRGGDTLYSQSRWKLGVKQHT